jgi:hypothetical protein
MNNNEVMEILSPPFIYMKDEGGKQYKVDLIH